MNFTIDQLHQALGLIQNKTNETIASEIGPEFLSKEDIRNIKAMGVDPSKIYDKKNDKILNAFLYGKLASTLRNRDTEKYRIVDLRDDIVNNRIKELSEREAIVLSHLKVNLFNDVKLMEGRIFKDISHILIKDTLANQRMLLKKEIKNGVAHKKTIQEIASAIAIKTGDWQRNFKIIVQYSITQAFEQGKANQLFINYGPDVLVYKKVHTDACDHCKKLFNDSKTGKPKTFRLISLMDNGDNIGVKTKDWKPVIGPVHPYCRCELMYYKILVHL